MNECFGSSARVRRYHNTDAASLHDVMCAAPSPAGRPKGFQVSSQSTAAYRLQNVLGRWEHRRPSFTDPRPPVPLMLDLDPGSQRVALASGLAADDGRTSRLRPIVTGASAPVWSMMPRIRSATEAGIGTLFARKSCLKGPTDRPLLCPSVNLNIRCAIKSPPGTLEIAGKPHNGKDQDAFPRSDRLTCALREIARLHQHLIGDIIAKGGSSSVRVCDRKGHSKLLRAKVMRNYPDTQRTLFNELIFAPPLVHPHMLRICDIPHRRTDRKGPPTGHRPRGLLAAVEYLHSHQICHRDITLEKEWWPGSQFHGGATGTGGSIALEAAEGVQPVNGFAAQPCSPSWRAPGRMTTSTRSSVLIRRISRQSRRE